MCNFNKKVLFLQKNEPNSIIIYYNCSINFNLEKDERRSHWRMGRTRMECTR